MVSGILDLMECVICLHGFHEMFTSFPGFKIPGIQKLE